ncbi:lipid-binding protein [Gaetbulibacter saemankumensis]|uniref:lipid-binding protein n=1 Tax=Gaetbulibacter saemankumensis TaxID=311208 RepID=UPI00041F22EE|nr:lipid-binding protein [Gaetbulibacter saemankumensis]
MKYTILNKIIKSLFTLVLLLTIASCEQQESVPDDSGIIVSEIVGGWWVIALEPDGTTPAYGGDYVKFNTYNSSMNDLTFWLDDNGEWMELKAKATVDLSSLTFSSDEDTTEYYTDETVTITNGKFTKNSYTTTSNTVVDEIMFEAEFSWDPGIVYIFKGHKNTGIIADQNPHY